MDDDWGYPHDLGNLHLSMEDYNKPWDGLPEVQTNPNDKWK